MISDSTFRSLARHDEYYIAGGDLYFMVEHVLFRVHRYFFDRESLYFRNKLATPASPGATRSGTSDSTAIVLEDVRPSDFARFLWVFYNPKYSLYKTDVDSWTAILDLAFKWQFPEVKRLCVRELERLEMSDVQRIHVYHKYAVDRNLLIGRYAALCEREEPLSVAEGMLLGMETALTLARAREIARSKPADSGLRSPTKANVPANTLTGIIKSIFDIPPPQIEEATSPTSPTNVNGNVVNGQAPQNHGARTNGANGIKTPPTSGSATPPNGATGTAGAPANDVFGLLVGNPLTEPPKDAATPVDKPKDGEAGAPANLANGEQSTPSRVSSPHPGDDTTRGRGRGRGGRR